MYQPHNGSVPLDYYGLNRLFLVHESVPLHWLYMLGQFPDPFPPQFPHLQKQGNAHLVTGLS